MNDVEQMLAGRVDTVQTLALPVVHAIAPHQVGHAGDGVERGADFVAHVGQKGRFGPVGRVGLILGDEQLACPLAHHAFEVLAVLGQLQLDLLAFGDVAGTADSADNLPGAIDKGSLGHLQAPILAAHPAGFLETTGRPPRQGLGIARLALLAEGVPLRITRMRGALALGKEGIRPAQRFVRVAGPEKAAGHGLIDKQEASFRVLGPDHVRHVVAHQAQHGGQPGGMGLGCGQCGFHPATLDDFVVQLQITLDRLGCPPRVGCAAIQDDDRHAHHEYGQHAEKAVATFVPQPGITKQHRQPGNQRDIGIEALQHGIGQGGHRHHAEGQENSQGMVEIVGIARHQQRAGCHHHGGKHAKQAPPGEMTLCILQAETDAMHPAFVGDHCQASQPGDADPGEDQRTPDRSAIEEQGKNQRNDGDAERIAGRMAEKGFDADQMDAPLDRQLARCLTKAGQRKEIAAHFPSPPGKGRHAQPCRLGFILSV